MELSETLALADTFFTSLIFNVHSVPLSDRVPSAATWWREQESRIPLRAALNEKRKHSAQFASRRQSERNRGQEIYLTIFAIVDEYGNRKCPALVDARCGIHERRPLTCRTVPLHYSRPPSVLQSYLDRFVATPGYECDTDSGPVILDGSRVVSEQIRSDRDRAVAQAKTDRKWKDQILALMDDPVLAFRVGLPTHGEVLDNFDRGHATFVPMIAAWRVAEYCGLMSSEQFRDSCNRQVSLIRSEMMRWPEASALSELLALYQVGAAGRGRLGSLTAGETR